MATPIRLSDRRGVHTPDVGPKAGAQRNTPAFILFGVQISSPRRRERVNFSANLRSGFYGFGWPFTEAKEFRDEVRASMADHEAGRVIEGAELIAELRAKHAS